jgi:flagellar biosynthesis component FlhA
MLARTGLRADGDVGDSVVLATFRALMDDAAAFCDLQGLERELVDVRAASPVVVEHALDGLDLSDVLAIVRALARERVPRPPLAAILTVLAESKRLRDPAERAELPELVRRRLASSFVHEVLDSVGQLGDVRWIRPSIDREEELLERWVVGVDGVALALAPTEREGWLGRMRGDGEHDAQQPVVVLVSARARRAFAELFVGTTPHVTVLSTAELEAARIPPPDDVAWVS